MDYTVIYTVTIRALHQEDALARARSIHADIFDRPDVAGLGMEGPNEDHFDIEGALAPLDETDPDCTCGHRAIAHDGEDDACGACLPCEKYTPVLVKGDAR